MNKIGIFYGSTTGNTERVARKIATRLRVSDSDVHNVAQTAPSAVDAYNVLLLGCSTWGDGDMQEDMHDFIDGLAALDLRNKKIGLFGCGDDTMSDTFCNAVGEMYEALKSTGATFVGAYNADGFDYSSTKANVDGQIVGLLIDNVNHDDLTDKKINSWCDEIESQI